MKIKLVNSKDYFFLSGIGLWFIAIIGLNVNISELKNEIQCKLD